MTNYNLYYQNKDSLALFIKNNHIMNSTNLLIQVFTSKNNKKYIQEILDNINLTLPSAHLIGSTTDGEIMDGHVSENKTVISFTIFENTSINSISVKHKDRGFITGQTIAKKLLQKDSKVIISFATCYNTSGEEYLNGINSINEKIIISGGIASHDNLTTLTYVFTKDEIISNGAVAISLQNKNLYVHNDFSYNWSKIGLELTVNEVEDNRVYKIDNKTPLEIYIHYLGTDIANNLPISGTEFPLIIKRDNFLISRAVTQVHKDGSLSFAGDFHIGDKVQFGYGDIKSIHKKSTDISKNIALQPAEVIFIYSCMARRHYLNNDIENETLPLATIASTSGFFTHGEFYTDKKREFLNQTMTLLVLSEDSKINDIGKISKISKKFSHQALSINALANLINVVSDEVNLQKKELIKQKNLFENLFEKSADGILILKDNTFVQCNQRAYKMLGYNSKEELLTMHPANISPEFQDDGKKSFEKANDMIKLANENGVHQFEWIHLKADKTPIWFEVRLAPLEIENEHFIYVTWRDIQNKKKMEEKLLSQKESLYLQANHDSLTGLANRNLFYNRLEQAINRAKRKNTKIALFFIDLDMFKDVNDSLGHDIGDILLKEVSNRFTKNTRKEDTVSRIGGDEFTIILENIKDIDIVSQKASLLRNEIAKQYNIHKHTINISCSIGISIFPDDTNKLNDLIKYADTAMYKSKAEGRNKQWFYSNEMTTIISNKIKTDNEIRDSLKNNHFKAYYQAFFDTKTNKILGAEALIRWYHPQKGLLLPHDFMPIAEKSDLIIMLDDWMMNSTMEYFSNLYKQGLNPGILSLNLSINQLETIDYVDKLQLTMEKYSFNPKWLKLEILENKIMQRTKHNIIILTKLKDMGICIAIDDFGIGESSFTYLKRFPITQIKIDKSFIINMSEDKNNKEIAKAIIALGNALDIEVLAEGVENKEDKEYLEKYNCSLMQGNYFAKPINENEFSKLLKK